MKQYQIDALKEKYPQGTKVQLNYMKGESHMPFGLAGTVQFVDDAGQIHCHWENGSTLAVVPEVDSISIIPKVMEERQNHTSGDSTKKPTQNRGERPDKER